MARQPDERGNGAEEISRCEEACEDEESMTLIVPLATIGIVGGGQLGRMTALAARSAGYRVHALDPDAECAIGPVVERCIAAEWNDEAAALELARGCDVITFEIEKASVAAL